MNFMEAIKYLKEDEDNRVICTDDNLYKFDGIDLCRNNSKNYPDADWYKIHPYNTWTLDGKFKIYEEGKLYSFAEMMEYITSDKYKDSSVFFKSVIDPTITASLDINSNLIIFEDAMGHNECLPIVCYFDKWRKIK